MTLLGAQNILGAGWEVAGEEELEAAEVKKGVTAAKAEELATFPLASPQIRHWHRVCLTTPHPPHLLRSEHG